MNQRWVSKVGTLMLTLVGTSNLLINYYMSLFIQENINLIHKNNCISFYAHAIH